MIRQLNFLYILTIALVGCKTETKQTTTETQTVLEENKEVTTAERIAQAHGYDNWKYIDLIDFTFNVDRGDSHFERSWSWSPKTNTVRLSTTEDTIKYNRASVDSLSLNADKGFINDKYWLLVPFQLVWDEGTTISNPIKKTAPISNAELNMITLTYSDEGGYTPGDAYDIYFDDEYIIREWVFREGNSEKPSMTTTFENYQDFGGIKIAKDHKMTDGNFNLYFTNIEVN
ncbi:hypothetical protein [uncultured Psychroserpens sp.]|uniref:hypothetical protein n=1 Tax=uncultured Psychroserpens sp. TaxID=255436 RepID=UPI00262D54EC|nr:hypothetical protein [uncultured Psychroserpens sp.]